MRESSGGFAERSVFCYGGAGQLQSRGFFAAVFQGALERGGGFFWRGFLELRLLRRGVLGAKDGSKLVLWVSSRGKPERN